MRILLLGAALTLSAAGALAEGRVNKQIHADLFFVVASRYTLVPRALEVTTKKRAFLGHSK